MFRPISIRWLSRQRAHDTLLPSRANHGTLHNISGTLVEHCGALWNACGVVAELCGTLQSLRAHSPRRISWNPENLREGTLLEPCWNLHGTLPCKTWWKSGGTLMESYLKTSPDRWWNLVEMKSGGTLVEPWGPWWKSGGTLVEPS